MKKLLKFILITALVLTSVLLSTEQANATRHQGEKIQLLAKDFSTKTTGSRFFWAWGLWRNGKIEHTFELPTSGYYQIKVKALGHRAGNEFPRLEVLHNNEIIAQRSVKSRHFKTYKFSPDKVFSAGANTFGLQFSNDYFKSRWRDRNLILLKFELKLIKKVSECDEANNECNDEETANNTPIFSEYAKNFAVKTDGRKRGRYSWILYRNGYIANNVQFDQAGTYEFKVTARGKLAGNEPPLLGLSVNGVIVDQVFIDHRRHRTYSLGQNVTIEAGTHEIGLHFLNDYFTRRPWRDRNLILKQLEIYPLELIKPSVCGDGIVNGDEVCDGEPQACMIGGYSGEKACNNDCSAFLDCSTNEFCGDGITNGTEVCDRDRVPCIGENGYNGLRSCLRSCDAFATNCVLREFCGDGIINGNEQCDDGNNTPGDGCSIACTNENLENNFKNAISPIGMNVASFNHDEVTFPYLNVFKKANDFISVMSGIEDNGVLDVDHNGWVKSLSIGQFAVAKVLSSTAPNTFPSGEYTLYYEGDGMLAFAGTAVIDIVDISSHEKRIQLDFSDSDPKNFDLVIVNTNPTDYIRNIVIVPPGGMCDGNRFIHYEDESTCLGEYIPYTALYQDNLFHPQFLANLRDYRVLRFVEPLGIDSSDVIYPTDLKNLNSTTYSNTTPYEVIIELVNQLNADLWLNIPHLASDELVTYLAELINSQLAPDLKVYLEYSNDVFNRTTMNTQGAEIAQRGCTIGLVNSTDCDVDTNSFNGIYCEGLPQILNDTCFRACELYYSKRSVEVALLFEQTLSNPNRLIKIIAGVSGQEAINETILTFNNAYFYFDMMATSSLFGDYIPNGINADAILDWLALGEEFALQQIFQEINSGGVVPDPDDAPFGALFSYRDQLALDAAVASRYGLTITSFQGGHAIEHTEGIQEVVDFLEVLTNDPRMQTIYQDYFNQWRNNGGELMMYYKSHSNSTYGLFQSEFEAIQGDPKYHAIDNFIQQNPCWWNFCSIGDIP